MRFVENNNLSNFFRVQSLSFSQNIYKYFTHVRFFIGSAHLLLSYFVHRNTYVLTVILHSTSMDTHNSANKISIIFLIEQKRAHVSTQKYVV